MATNYMPTKDKVYILWTKDNWKTPIELWEETERKVKLSTVKAWLQSWSKGKNLPASARKYQSHGGGETKRKTWRAVGKTYENRYELKVAGATWYPDVKEWVWFGNEHPTTVIRDIQWEEYAFTEPENNQKKYVSSTDEELKKLNTYLQRQLDESRRDLRLMVEKVVEKEANLKEKQNALENTKQEIENLKKRKPRVIHLKRYDGKIKKLKGHRHVVYEEVLMLANMRMNIFIPGPSGCGKSYLAEQIANDLGYPFYFINCSVGMSEGHITGRLLPTVPDRENMIEAFRWYKKKKLSAEAAAALAAAAAGAFDYVISQFVNAFEKGGVFLADELDAADPNVLLKINSSLANNIMAVENRQGKPTAKRHEDFIFIGAANTFGRGADRLYVGRNQLDEATLDRMRISTVPMDYDKVLEEQLCPDDELRNRLQRYRETASRNRLERIISTRFLEHAYIMKTKANWDDNKIDEKLFQGWSEDEVHRVRDVA